MKKIYALLIAVSVSVFALAAPSSVSPGKSPKLKASEIFIPIGQTGYKISLLELSKIKASDMEKLTGKKMSLANKATLKIAQNQLSHSISKDGTLNSKRFNKLASKAEGGDFHLGGFALGFFLWIVGVLIAYLLNDDNKSVRIKWAWIGFVVSLVLWLLLAVVL